MKEEAPHLSLTAGEGLTILIALRSFFTNVLIGALLSVMRQKCCSKKTKHYSNQLVVTVFPLVDLTMVCKANLE